MTRIAVVILNYNGEALLRQFLPTVIRHSSMAHIVVADNGSTDQSVSVISKEFPAVQLITLQANFGFCGGYNRALQLVDAEFFVLLNSDIEVTAGWLEPLLELAETDASIAAIQPKILAYRSKDYFEYAGAGGGFIDLLGYPFCRGRLFQTIEQDQGQYNDVREVFWASGACLFIRSSAYRQMGGFDEDFFAHMEEIDLCWKLQRVNKKVMYCGRSTVYHVGAGTLSYESPRKTLLNFRNNLSLLYTHLDTSEMAYKLPVKIALDWLATINFLFNGSAKNALAVLKAHLQFIQQLRRIHAKRVRIRGLHPTYPKRNIYPRSIVVEYFFKKRKKITI